MSKQSKTIEEKMNELREMTAWFESEEFSLTEAADKFKQANALAKDIEKDLGELRNTVNELKQSFET